MSMSMRRRFGQSQTAKHKEKQKLDYNQKCDLRQLLQLRLDLRKEAPPQAVRGIEGIIAADKILKDRYSYGILIGGCAEEAWRENATLEDFYSHKDVDVLVLNSYFELERDFEGGIDWWLPRPDPCYKTPHIYIGKGNNTSWKNGNGVFLSCGIESDDDLPVDLHCYIKSGLYLPNKGFIADMTVVVSRNLTGKFVKSEQAVDKFYKRLMERSMNGISEHISNALGKQILHWRYAGAHAQSLLRVREAGT